MRILDQDSAYWGEKIGFSTEAEGALEWAVGGGVESMWLLLDAARHSEHWIAQEDEFSLMDIRVTLERRTVGSGGGSRLVRPEDLAVLRQIARTAYRGITRFYVDPAYRGVKADRYYEEWVRRAVTGEADIVLVADREDNPVGFVTIHLGPETSSIGLIAVAADYRGRGVGQELVSSAVNWAHSQKRPQMTVATQGRNLPAQRLFQRLGFVTYKTELWFHGRTG